MSESPSYQRVADLPLRIERYSLEPLSKPVSSEFTRHSTVIRLAGAGEEGVGEDVVYEEVDQLAQQTAGAFLELAGDWTLDGLARHLDGLDLFPRPPVREPSRDYRRWAFESAALDLALRQAGRSLADALGRAPAPVSFVTSLGLGDPPTTAPLLALRAANPAIGFKLDPRPTWDAALIAEVVALGGVEVLDLKGQYKGTPVDVETDPVLYGRLLAAFPQAWIEDPALENGSPQELEGHMDRVTWDAPIHSWEDVEALGHRPRMLNCKPSRFGPIRRLFHFYDRCAAEGIALYGGGQFELGPGRGQIQYLASIFHPDAPNDVAPGAYHEPASAPALPTSPLPPALAPAGFRWEG